MTPPTGAARSAGSPGSLDVAFSDVAQNVTGRFPESGSLLLSYHWGVLLGCAGVQPSLTPVEPGCRRRLTFVLRAWARLACQTRGFRLGRGIRSV